MRAQVGCGAYRPESTGSAHPSIGAVPSMRVDEAKGRFSSGTVAWRDRASLLELADGSLADLLTHLASFGGTAEERDGVLLFAGPHSHPNPYRNGALRLSDGVPAAAVLSTARSFFGPRNRGFALWTREHADTELDELARAQDLPELERIPEMVMEELGAELPLPDGVVLRRASDEATRLDYLDVVASGWGMAGMARPTAARVFFDPASLDVPHVAAYVAYLDDH